MSTGLGLDRIGGLAGLGAVAIAAVQVGIEVVGWGILRLPVPGTIEGWFAHLQANRLLALTELTALQIPMFVLLVPLFLALHAGLRAFNPALTLLATAFALIGIAVYLASNTSVSVLSLSDQWAAATGGTERERLLAAGLAMLAIYEGPGLDAGVFLVMVATMLLSWIMLRSGSFGRLIAAAGLVTGLIGLAYYAAITMSSSRVLILEVSAPFFLVWVLLSARWLLGRTSQYRPLASTESAGRNATPPSEAARDRI